MMRTKNFTDNFIYTLLILTIFLFSCSTSNDVAQKGRIQKRKYNNGFAVSWKNIWGKHIKREKINNSFIENNSIDQKISLTDTNKNNYPSATEVNDISGTSLIANNDTNLTSSSLIVLSDKKESFENTAANSFPDKKYIKKNNNQIKNSNQYSLNKKGSKGPGLLALITGVLAFISGIFSYFYFFIAISLNEEEDKISIIPPFFPTVIGITGVILGILGLSKNSHKNVKKWLGLAGLITGAIAILLGGYVLLITLAWNSGL